MGGFRRFMPGHRDRVRHRELAIAGVPPLAGFWAKDDDPRERVLRPRLRRLRDRSRRRAAHRPLHDPRDLAGLLRQRALPPAGRGGGRGRHGRRRGGRRGRRREAAPAEVARTPSTTPRRRRRSTTARRRVPPTSTATTRTRAPDYGAPGAGARVRCRSSAGCLNLPFEKLEFLDPVPRARRSRGCASREPDAASGRRSGSTCVAVVIALVGIGIALLHLPRRARATPAVDPLDRQARPARPALRPRLYYDDGDRRARRRPDPRAPRSGSTACSTRRSSTARSTASPAASARAAPGAPASRTGLVRRYALGIVLGAVALLLCVVRPGGRCS